MSINLFFDYRLIYEKYALIVDSTKNIDSTIICIGSSLSYFFATFDLGSLSVHKFRLSSDEFSCDAPRLLLTIYMCAVKDIHRYIYVYVMTNDHGTDVINRAPLLGPKIEVLKSLTKSNASVRFFRYWR